MMCAFHVLTATVSDISGGHTNSSIYRNVRDSHTEIYSAALSPPAITAPCKSDILKCCGHRHATWYGLSVSNTDFGLF